MSSPNALYSKLPYWNDMLLNELWQIYTSFIVLFCPVKMDDTLTLTIVFILSCDCFVPSFLCTDARTGSYQSTAPHKLLLICIHSFACLSFFPTFYTLHHDACVLYWEAVPKRESLFKSSTWNHHKHILFPHQYTRYWRMHARMSTMAWQYHQLDCGPTTITSA